MLICEIVVSFTHLHVIDAISSLFNMQIKCFENSQFVLVENFVHVSYFFAMLRFVTHFLLAHYQRAIPSLGKLQSFRLFRKTNVTKMRKEEEYILYI